MTVQDILDRYGLNYEQVSKITDIPIRTIQNWCLGYREPAPYMVKLIDSTIQLHLQIEREKQRLRERFG